MLKTLILLSNATIPHTIETVMYKYMYMHARNLCSNNSVQKNPQIQSTTFILISADFYSKKNVIILMNCHSFNEHLFGILSALVIFFYGNTSGSDECLFNR